MIIIPARIGSTRFPNKVLVDIGGLPMVIRTAKAVMNVDDVVIATDAQEVIDVAHAYGINTVLTSTEHQSGTDRIYEAAKKLNLKDDDIVINVQGDEPFIETEVVQAIYDLTSTNKDVANIMMNSCYKHISEKDANDVNIVKVVTDENNMALYFSRAKVPFARDKSFNEYKGHLGIYGFTVKALKEFCMLPPAPLEEIEKLEQLRALYHGQKIAMTEVKTQSFGIDTPEDLEKVLKHHNS